MYTLVTGSIICIIGSKCDLRKLDYILWVKKCAFNLWTVAFEEYLFIFFISLIK